MASTGRTNRTYVLQLRCKSSINPLLLPVLRYFNKHSIDPTGVTKYNINDNKWQKEQLMETTNNFKRTVAQKNTTLEAVALALGIDRSTLYRKTKGGLSSLTLGEAKRITKFLRLSEAEATELFWS